MIGSWIVLAALAILAPIATARILFLAFGAEDQRREARRRAAEGRPTRAAGGYFCAWPYVFAIVVALYVAAAVVNKLQGGQGNLLTPTEGP